MPGLLALHAAACAAEAWLPARLRLGLLGFGVRSKAGRNQILLGEGSRAADHEGTAGTHGTAQQGLLPELPQSCALHVRDSLHRISPVRKPGPTPKQQRPERRRRLRAPSRGRRRSPKSACLTRGQGGGVQGCSRLLGQVPGGCQDGQGQGQAEWVEGPFFRFFEANAEASRCRLDQARADAGLQVGRAG